MAIVRIAGDRSLLPNGSPVGVYFYWDEDVTGFTASDITLSVGVKGELVGSNSVYRLTITAPDTGNGSLTVTVAEDAVDQTNAETAMQLPYGNPRSLSPVISAGQVNGYSLVHSDADYIYTAGDTPTPRQLLGLTPVNFYAYDESGNQQSTQSLDLYTGGLGLDIFQNRFLIDHFDSNRTDLKLYSSTAAPSSNLSGLQLSTNAVFDVVSDNQHQILDTAVGPNRVWALHVDVSVPIPEMEFSSFELDGTPSTSFTIPTNDNSSDSYRNVAGSIVVIHDRLYVGWNRYFTSRQTSILALPTLMTAYDFNGERDESSDITLPESLRGGHVLFGVVGADVDRTTNELWLLVAQRSGNVLTGERRLAHINVAGLISGEVDAVWGVVSELDVQSGDTIDLNPYVSNATSIQFGVGYNHRSWLRLRDGILEILSNGLPVTATSVEIPIVAVGVGEPDFTTIRLRLSVPEAPVWETIPALVVDEGDTLDMNEFVSNADSIVFASPPSAGLTITNGVISVPRNAVQTDTTIEVRLTATNAIGQSNVTFDLTIINSAVAVRNISYQDLPIHWRVTIGGVDVSQKVTSVDNIQHTLDLVVTGEFNISECTLQVDNSENNFQDGGSFYRLNNIENVYSTLVIVEVGFLRDSSVVLRRQFTGHIQSLREDRNQQLVTAVCVDESSALRTTEIRNFGVTKNQIRLSGEAQGARGVYPIPDALTPISDDSLEGTSAGSPLNVIRDGQLNLIGTLSPRNVMQTATSLQSEGGLLDNDPIVTFRTGYTYLPTGQFVSNLLESFNIHNLDYVESPPIEDNHFYSIGRVGFNDEQLGILRYAKDVVASSTKLFILTGSPYQDTQDALWEFDPATAEWQILTSFDITDEVWQLATEDFNTFYVMATRKRSNINVIPVGTYDASEATANTASRVKILRYSRTADTVTTFIDDSATHPPQLATFYSVGFPRDNSAGDRYGKLPDTRSGFDVKDMRLYYRYANSTAYGVAVADTGGTTASFIAGPGPPDEFGSGSSFNFHISGTDLYFGYTHAPTDSTVLRVQKKGLAMGSNTVTLAQLADTPPTPSVTALTGVLEMLEHETTLYFVAQKHPREDSGIYARDGDANASATLYAISTELTSPETPVVVKEYPSVQTAVRSLVVHNNVVHGFEGSHYAYKYVPVDNEEWKGSIGRVQTFTPTSAGASLGVAWRTELDNPSDATDAHYGIHGGTASPMVSLNGILYLIPAYGNFDDIGRDAEAEINRRLNDTLVAYGTERVGRFPAIPVRQQSVYSVMQEISRSTNSVFGVENSRFFMKPRVTSRAKTSSAVDATATSLDVQSATATFPETGHVVVGFELIEYTGRTASQLTGLSRGRLGTPASAHDADVDVYLIDHILDAESVASPILSIAINDDWGNLSNSVSIRYDGQEFLAEDTESIQTYGRKELSVSTLLHFTQQAQAEALAQTYLETFRPSRNALTLNWNSLSTSGSAMNSTSPTLRSVSYTHLTLPTTPYV